MKKIKYIFVLLLCFVVVTIEKINAQCTPPSTFNQGNGTCSDINLYWSSSSGATGYYLDISTDIDFINKLPNYNNRNVGTTNTYLVSGLNSNSTYYARIRACNSSDPRANSSILTCFTTAVPQPPTANGGSGAASNKITANWSFVGGVDGYYVELFTKNGANYNPVPGYEKLNAGNSTSLTITGLTPSTTYYYRVKTYSGTCESGSSNMISYTTLSYEAPPSVPTGFAQVYGTCNEIYLYWNEASNATGYYLDVSTNSSFDSFVEGYNNKNIGFTTSFNVNSNLTSGTTYYARVRAFNSSSTSASSNILTCNTSAFPAPVAIAGSGATTNQITVNWNSQGNVSGYYLDLSTNSSFTEIVQGYYNYPVGNVTSKTITGLKSGTKYYYRVKSYSGACVSNYSNTIDYATLLNAPSAPVGISQDYGNCHLMSFHWPAIPDATSYYLDISTEASFSSFVVGYNNLNIGNEPNYTVDKNLSPNTTYYIRLRASNASGTSSSSDPLRCTTSNTLPTPIISGGIASSNQITLNWSGGDSYGYLLDISLNNSFDSYVETYHNYDIGKETSRTISNLIPGTSYYFRVKSYLTGCESEASTVKSYATVPLSNVNNENYIITRTILKDNVKDISSVSSLTTQDMQQSLVYYDGLGRPMQQVSWRSSPTMMDIIQPIAYDEFGREPIKFLPYVDLDREGLYRANALNETYSLSDHYKFYTNGFKNAPDVINDISENGLNYNQPLNKEVNIIAPLSISLKPGFSSNGHNMSVKVDPTASFSSDAIEDKIKPFSVSVFDASPLNRVLEQGAPGEDWQPSDNSGSSSGHTQKTVYAFNDQAEILQLSINESGQLVNDKGEQSNAKYYYEANELEKVVAKNENWQEGNGKKFTSEVFTNKSGQKVVTRNYLDDSTPVETYNVYDDLGRLRYVIAPEAISRLTFPLDKNSTVIKQYCFYYEYDENGRMTLKQVPGAEPVYMVYDIRDRLVLTQDGELRKSNTWLFTKYDAFNRAVLTGKYANSTATSLSAMQSVVNGVYSGTTPRKFFVERTDEGGYADESFPTAADGASYLTMTYYDTYGFPSQKAFDYSAMDYVTSNFKGYNTQIIGQVTGTSVKVLKTDSQNDPAVWITTTNYYDEEYRNIQSVKNMYTGTGTDTEVTCNRYDFTGKLLQTYTSQLIKVDTKLMATAYSRYNTYDHAGRLIKVENEFSDIPGSKVTLAERVYNELGQLVKKKLHGGLQEIDYKYNIRGWITQMNDPDNLGSDLFGMKLYYNGYLDGLNTSSDALYNGNIAAMKWKNTACTTTKAYAYRYDGLNRILSANYGEAASNWNNDAFDETIRKSATGAAYDLNGNILGLIRNNKDGSALDNLDYRYEGNRLMALGIAGNAALATNTYGYDDNGNMTSNTLKNITITYNHFNKPQLVNFGSNNKIEYIYDALGNKLKQKVYTAGSLTTTTDYVGSIVYKNKQLHYIVADDGRITKVSPASAFVYEYHIKDHLNTRVAFEVNAANNGINVVQQKDYYPFGVGHNISNYLGNDNKLQYNGKELQDDFGLGWYDYGFRFYDPQTCRFVSVDPLANDYTYKTPYDYAENRPIDCFDLDGLESASAIMVGAPPSPGVAYLVNGGRDQRLAMEVDRLYHKGGLIGGAAALSLPFIVGEASLWSGMTWSGFKSLPTISNYLTSAASVDLGFRSLSSFGDAFGQFSFQSVYKGDVLEGFKSINWGSSGMTFLNPYSYYLNGTISSAFQFNTKGFSLGSASDVLLGGMFESIIGKSSEIVSNLFKIQIGAESSLLTKYSNLGSSEAGLQSQKLFLLKTTSQLTDPSFQFMKNGIITGYSNYYWNY